MLIITIPGGEFWDKQKRVFVYPEDVTLELEHSLVSLSKWEQIVKKPFIGSEKTEGEALLYIKCMVLNGEFPAEVFLRLNQELVDEITAYIYEEKTATWFNEDTPARPNTQAITSELIYSWMVNYEIPFEAKDWHLSNLLTLIKVIDRQRSSANKKTNTADIARRQRAINRARLKKYETPG